MQSSTEQVLQTYELLELILYHLPIHDLFILARVCKKWHTLLHRSVSLQQQKYLVPNGPALQPLDYLYNATGSRTRALYDPAPLRLNPALQVLGLIHSVPESQRPALATFGVSDQKNMFLQFEIKGFPIYERRILGEEASWRGMLLTQPPVMAVNFEFLKREPHGGSVTVWSREGVTFGLVQEWLVRLGEEFEIETGRSKEETFESVSFCLMHPSSGDQVEEVW